MWHVECREVFMTAISVVGLGWNFSFIPVTAILPHCFNTPEEKVVQLYCSSVSYLCVNIVLCYQVLAIIYSNTLHIVLAYIVTLYR